MTSHAGVISCVGGSLVFTPGASTLGDTDPNVAQIEQVLGPALPNKSDLQRAVTAYTGLSAAQQSSIVNIASTLTSGGTPSLTMMAPIIAGALLATGVGAPAAAVVAALLPLGDALLSALGLGGGPQSCLFTVGGACFSGRIPAGPEDARWVTWDKVLADWRGQEPPATDGNLWLPNRVVPGWQIIECELPKLIPTIQPHAFLLSYYGAIIANAEQAVNGHPYSRWPGTDQVNNQAVLDVTLRAWNLAATDAATSLTVGPASGGPFPASCASVNPGDFLRTLLNGDLDNHDHDPIQIAIPKTQLGLPRPKRKPATTSAAATAGKVALVGGGAAAGAWLLAGRPSIGSLLRLVGLR